MDVLEQFMSNLPRLRHLELISDCNDDVADGHRWQIMVEKLLTLKFKLFIFHQLQPQQLESFRTDFWLHKKRWHVAYRNRSFFSVPHFASTNAGDYFSVPQWSTALDNEILYRNCDKLILTRVFKHRNVRCPNARTLVFEFDQDLSVIRELIDLSQIRNLILCSLPKQFSIRCLTDEMPNLYLISIDCDVNTFLEQLHANSNYRIRTLLCTGTSMTISYTDLNIDRLWDIFPRLEHLHIDCLCSIQQIFDFLHRLRYLSVASFRYVRYYVGDEKQQRFNIKSILIPLLDLRGLHYTYRFDRSKIYFWILPQQTQTSTINYRVDQFGRDMSRNSNCRHQCQK